ncbi:hypothetical protein [Pseudomonas capeferrum]
MRTQAFKSAITTSLPESGKVPMTSVNTRPAPYTVGYEQPQKPSPISYQYSARASERTSTQPDSAPLRPAMTPEQRGQFSSHSAIVNAPPSQGSEATDSLAELTQKNMALRAKFQGFAAEVGPQIQSLQQQVVDLTQQLNTPREATQPSSNQPEATPQNRSAGEQHTAPSQASPVTPNPSGTEPGQAQSLEALNRESQAFRQEVLAFFGELKTVIQQLQEQIQGLAQRIDAIGTPQNAVPSEPENSAEPGPSPDAAAPANDLTPAPRDEPEATAARGVEALMSENAQLQAGLDQMEAQFKAVIAQLQAQIETLSKKISEQKQ